MLESVDCNKKMIIITVKVGLYKRKQILYIRYSRLSILRTGALGPRPIKFEQRILGVANFIEYPFKVRYIESLLYSNIKILFCGRRAVGRDQ